MSEYNEVGLPPTIPPPQWIHNVTCYSPLLVEDHLALEKSRTSVFSVVRAVLIVVSTLTIILLNTFFVIILNLDQYKRWIKTQPRILITTIASSDLAFGILVMGIGLFPAVFECWPFGQQFCQYQALLRGSFTQLSSLLLIILAIERYVASVQPTLYTSMCKKSVCIITLCLSFLVSLIIYAMIVMPTGGFHFNINGLLVCEPYFLSNNVLILAACLFYFPTTMILMYCYGTIFHSAKVRVRYKYIFTTRPSLAEEIHPSTAEKLLEDRRICVNTSQSTAAISVAFIVVVTPWAVQQVITSCTKTIAPPTIDFFVSWLASSHRFLTPLIYYLLNTKFQVAVMHFLATKLQCRTLSVTWPVVNGGMAGTGTSHMSTTALVSAVTAISTTAASVTSSSNHNVNHIDSHEVSTREKFWGEILERTVSTQGCINSNGSASTPHPSATKNIIGLASDSRLNGHFSYDNQHGDGHHLNRAISFQSLNINVYGSQNDLPRVMQGHKSDNDMGRMAIISQDDHSTTQEMGDFQQH